MKKILICLSFTLITFPLYTNASTVILHATTTQQANPQELYTICKKSALLHQEKIMLPALKEYVSSSKTLTDNEQGELEKIKWYINSSYQAQSKKIQDKRFQAMIPINEKVARVRTFAQITLKAEGSLCDLALTKTTQTPKKGVKTAKK